MNRLLHGGFNRTRFFPFLVLLLSLLFFGSVVFSVDDLMIQKEKRRAHNEATVFASSVNRTVLQAASSAYALAALVHNGDGRVDRFYDLAPRLLSYYRGINTLVLLPDGVVSHIYPFEENANALGHDQFADPARNEIARLTRDSGKMTLTDPVQLIQGGFASIARLPVFLEDERGDDYFWGFASCTILFPDVLERSGTEALDSSGLRYVLWRRGGDGRPVVIHSMANVDVDRILSCGIAAELNILNAEWRVSALPEGGWRNFPLIFLLSLAGVALSALLALVARLVAGIRDNEEKYRVLADNAKDVIWMLSLPDFEFTYISPSVKELSGYSVEEAMKMRLDEYLESESLDHVKRLHAESLRLFQKKEVPEEGRLMEVRHRRKDGSFVWLGVRSSYILNDAGEPVGILGVSRDMTEIVRVQQELERANATKNTFLAIIAHDLRGSIGAIGQTLELLERNACDMDEDERDEFLSLAGEDARRVFSLLENLLTWSRSQLDQIAFKPVESRLRSIVDESAALLASRASEKEIVLINAVPEAMTARLDPGMTGVVLRNLLGNALKFTSAGGRVSVSARRTNEGVEVAVRDTGHGIPSEIAERLFRLDARHESSEGTAGERGSGLGLILCKEFVEKHGGRIWFESSPGEGTVFFFTLPDRLNGDPAEECGV